MKTLLHIGKKAFALWQMKSGPKYGAPAAHTTEISDLGPHCWDRPCSSTQWQMFPPVSLSLIQVSLWQGQGARRGRGGWQRRIRPTNRSDGLGWGAAMRQAECSPSLPSLSTPCSPLLFCTTPRHQHPDGGEPVAALPNKNSPSHYSSASPGAARSPASLPGLRIWLCNHRLALPLLPSLL